MERITDGAKSQQYSALPLMPGVRKRGGHGDRNRQGMRMGLGTKTEDRYAHRFRFRHTGVESRRNPELASRLQKHRESYSNVEAKPTTPATPATGAGACSEERVRVVCT